MGEPDGDTGASVMKTPPWLLAAPQTLEDGHTVTLDPAEARHLTGPLRRRQGDEIVLIDGCGAVAEAKLVAVAGGTFEAEILSVRREPMPLSEGVVVALGVVGNQPMDWAVQKLVEIGVRCLVPLETERAQARRRNHDSAVGHWRRIAMQALKQCRRAWAMEVADVTPLEEFVERESPRRDGVVADPGGRAVGDLPATAGRLLVVGPEGGFSTGEVQLFDRQGWCRLRLGRHVLRSETAAIVGGSILVARLEK
jgi:16S rRNA (uracil1498-N3)-methyltransferase